ncbi:MAG: hypothetical protein ACOX6D_09075 [Thermoguttaceae bacterium]|jgi:hypothetical protein
MKKISFASLIFALLLAARAAFAADYYIDSDHGDDKNTGTSPESAWASLKQVNEFRFAPGDRVLFARGGLWRGSLQLQSGTEGAPLYYGAYGKGAKPILLGSVPLSNEINWLPAGENLWVCSDAVVPAFGTTDVGNIILNGKKAAFKKWTKEDLKAQDDFWFDLTGDKHIYYYSEENPGKRYIDVEAAIMKYVISHTGSSYVVFDGFDIRYGSSHGFGGGEVSHYVIRNCDISWIGGGDQYKGGGEGRRVRFGNGVEFWGSADDCLVENNKLWEIYDAALTNQGVGGNVQSNITYRNNLIWNAEYSFEYWNGEGSETKNILFEKNLCYNAGFGWGHVQRADPNGRCVMVYQNAAHTENVVIRDNVFCDAINSLVRVCYCPTNPDWTTTGLTLDGNRYYNEGGRLFFLWLNEEFAENRFAEFQEKTGHEKNGVVAAPEKSIEHLKHWNHVY